MMTTSIKTRNFRNVWASNIEFGRPLAILLQAVWWGLLFGYAEAGLNMFLKFGLHRAIFQSQHFVWMIPLTLTILYLLIGGVIALISIRWPRAGSLIITVPIYVFLGILSIYYVKPKISGWAVLLLAGGIAIQTARVLAGRGQAFHRFVLKTLPWMAALLAVIWLVMRIFYP
jgi:hypothetical protein